MKEIDKYLAAHVTIINHKGKVLYGQNTEYAEYMLEEIQKYK